MINLWQAIVLGIIQGLTEFLPVSSSGHLVLLNQFFGIEDNFILLSILLHVATLVAVMVIFWKDIWYLIRHPFCDLSKKLIIATIPTVIIALLFKSFFKDAFSGVMLPLCFMITACMLLFADFWNGRQQRKKEEQSTLINEDILGDKKLEEPIQVKGNISYKSACLMGIFQGFAMLPGISRSGSTISAGIFMGEDKKSCAKFSFLMSIPIILASLLFEVIELCSSGTEIVINWLPLLVSVAFSFVAGLFAIKFMLRIVEKASYKLFSVYLIILGLMCLFI